MGVLAQELRSGQLLLIQSLDCYEGAFDFAGNYRFRRRSLTYNHHMCEYERK